MLRKLWTAGKTAREISEAMGCFSRNAVIGRAHKLGLEARKSPIDRTKPKKITMLALAPNMCRWPFNDPHQPDFHFCGALKSHEHPYYPEHVKVAYKVAS